MNTQCGKKIKEDLTRSKNDITETNTFFYFYYFENFEYEEANNL